MGRNWSIGTQNIFMGFILSFGMVSSVLINSNRCSIFSMSRTSPCVHSAVISTVTPSGGLFRTAFSAASIPELIGPITREPSPDAVLLTSFLDVCVVIKTSACKLTP